MDSKQKIIIALVSIVIGLWLGIQFLDVAFGFDLIKMISTVPVDIEDISQPVDLSQIPEYEEYIEWGHDGMILEKDAGEDNIDEILMSRLIATDCSDCSSCNGVDFNNDGTIDAYECQDCNACEGITQGNRFKNCLECDNVLGTCSICDDTGREYSLCQDVKRCILEYTGDPKYYNNYGCVISLIERNENVPFNINTLRNVLSSCENELITLNIGHNATRELCFFNSTSISYYDFERPHDFYLNKKFTGGTWTSGLFCLFSCSYIKWDSAESFTPFYKEEGETYPRYRIYIALNGTPDTNFEVLVGNYYTPPLIPNPFDERQVKGINYDCIIGTLTTDSNGWAHAEFNDITATCLGDDVNKWKADPESYPLNGIRINTDTNKRIDFVNFAFYTNTPESGGTWSGDLKHARCNFRTNPEENLEERPWWVLIPDDLGSSWNTVYGDEDSSIKVFYDSSMPGGAMNTPSRGSIKLGLGRLDTDFMRDCKFDIYVCSQDSFAEYEEEGILTLTDFLMGFNPANVYRRRIINENSGIIIYNYFEFDLDKDYTFEEVESAIKTGFRLFEQNQFLFNNFFTNIDWLSIDNNDGIYENDWNEISGIVSYNQDCWNIDVENYIRSHRTRNLIGNCPGDVCGQKLKVRVAFKYRKPDDISPWKTPLYPTITFCGLGATATAVCGNGVCEIGEDPSNCPADCSCNDSDGADKTNKGTCEDWVVSLDDYCINSTHICELVCPSPTSACSCLVNSACPLGTECIDGACVVSPSGCVPCGGDPDGDPVCNSITGLCDITCNGGLDAGLSIAECDGQAPDSCQGGYSCGWINRYWNVVNPDCARLWSDGNLWSCVDTCGYEWTWNGGQLNCCGDDPNEANPYEDPETSCGDGNDNDCDGDIDCDDSDCASNPLCGVTCYDFESENNPPGALPLTDYLNAGYEQCILIQNSNNIDITEISFLTNNNFLANFRVRESTGSPGNIIGTSSDCNLIAQTWITCPVSATVNSDFFICVANYSGTIRPARNLTGTTPYTAWYYHPLLGWERWSSDQMWVFRYRHCTSSGSCDSSCKAQGFTSGTCESPTGGSFVASAELLSDGNDYTDITDSEANTLFSLFQTQGFTEFTMRFPSWGYTSSGATNTQVSNIRRLMSIADNYNLQVNLDLHTWYTTWDNDFRDSAPNSAANRADYIQYVRNTIPQFESEPNLKAWMVLNEPQARTASASENSFILDVINEAKTRTSRPVSVRFMMGYSPSTGHYATYLDDEVDFLSRNSYWDSRDPLTAVYGATRAKFLDALNSAHNMGKELWITEFGNTGIEEEQRDYFEKNVAYYNSEGVDRVFAWAIQTEGTESYNIFNGMTPKPAFYELVSDSATTCTETQNPDGNYECSDICCCSSGGGCGNNIIEGGEECDGIADAACPGLCQADCTCLCTSTKEWQVLQNSDDVYRRLVPNLFTVSSMCNYAGDASSATYDIQTGMRFTNIDVPQGVTIDSAYLKFTANGLYGLMPQTIIEGEDADNANTFVGIVDYDNRIRTISSVSWTPPSWTSNQEVISNDIKDIIQEIIDRPGWVSGNALALFWRDNFGYPGQQSLLCAHSYNSDPTLAPKLEITYLC